MRSLGEFLGHIVKGVTTDVEAPSDADSTTVEKTVTEKTEGNVTYRETVIREVEVRKSGDGDASSRDQ